MPTAGECRLCHKSKMLVDSHIFPAGAYKRFVSDQSKGGSFLNLKYMNVRPSNSPANGCVPTASRV